MAASAQGPTAPAAAGADRQRRRGHLSGVSKAGARPRTAAATTSSSGYKNRNRTQTVEIPIGPNNRIEPGGPDYGQPTVFEPGRQTTVFAIKVPKDFGTKKLTWTLVANGQPAVVTFYLNPEYNMNFYREEANGNDATEDEVRSGRADDERADRRVRADAHRNGRPAGAAQAVGVGSAAAARRTGSRSSPSSGPTAAGRHRRSRWPSWTAR